MENSLPFHGNKKKVKSSAWNLPAGALKRFGRGYVTDITLSPEEDHLAVTTPLGLWMYNISTRESLTLVEWIPGAIAFSMDGKWIATTSKKGDIEVWDMNDEGCLVELARAKNESTDELVFSPDRKYLAVGGICRRSKQPRKHYYSVEVWSLPQNATTDAAPLHIERDRIYAGSHPLTFSPDSRLLAFAVPEGIPEPYRSDGYPVINDKWVLPKCCIAVCEITTGRHLTTLDVFNDLNTISFSPCGQFLAAADYKGTVYVWQVPEGFSPGTSSWHLHKVYQGRGDKHNFHLVSYSPQGALRTATRSFEEGIITIREPERNETLYKHPKDNIHYQAYFSNGTSLAFAGTPDVHVWTLGDKHSTCVSQMHGFPPHSLHFSLDGRTLLATQREDGIFSWEVTRPDKSPNIFNPTGSLPHSDASDTYFSLNVSSEGKHFVISGDENTVRLWELGIDTPIAAFPIQEKAINATFSPTANLIACRDVTNQIYIWDVTTEKLSDTYVSERDIDLWDAGLTFSPNGTYLAYSRCHIYDVIQCDQIDDFMGDYFQFLAFSSDSVHFWDTGSPDTIELWNIQRCEEVLTLQKPEEWNQKEVHTLSQSACGRYLACSPIMYENDVSISLGIWDIHKGSAPIATFMVPDACDTLGLAFSPDNTVLACAGDSGAILLWDLKPYLQNT